MNDSTRSQLALATWQHCQSRLQPDLATKLTPHSKGPQPLKKHGGELDISLLRILPIRSEMQPPHFWGAVSSYYEIGVGQYDGSPLILGSVGFLKFLDRQQFRPDAHAKPLTEILTRAHNKRKADFVIGTNSGGDARMPSIFRRYRANPFKFFPVETAGDDLAWLISETFPRIQALS